MRHRATLVLAAALPLVVSPGFGSGGGRSYPAAAPLPAASPVAAAPAPDLGLPNVVLARPDLVQPLDERLKELVGS